MLTPDLARTKFSIGVDYRAYVAGAKPAERENWARFESRALLGGPQRALVAGFTRRMPVLVLSGTWCGDCAAQCPILAAIAAVNPMAIDLRFLDRDAHTDLADRVLICGGRRVPTVIFLSEDFDFVSIAGDKSISRLRASAAKALGASCPLPGAGVPEDEYAATIQDWVVEFERAHLLVRLSTKLRDRHGD
jgi:thiol-disulfide isomerase/thioredoxin